MKVKVQQTKLPRWPYFNESTGTILGYDFLEVLGGLGYGLYDYILYNIYKSFIDLDVVFMSKIINVSMSTI